MILTNAPRLTAEQAGLVMAAVNSQFTDLYRSDQAMTELGGIEPGFTVESVPAQSGSCKEIQCRR